MQCLISFSAKGFLKSLNPKSATPQDRGFDYKPNSDEDNTEGNTNDKPSDKKDEL